MSVRFHFSEVHSQVFKGQRAFQLNTWRFLSEYQEAALICEQAAWPRWVTWCVWLTRLCASSSSDNNLPLGNSHHLFSILMAPSALASWFWASVYFGESSVTSGSSASMRALTAASLVTPKPLAACLAVLSVSLFPEPRGYPLYDILSSV